MPHANKQFRKVLLTLNRPQEKGITHDTIRESIKTLKSTVYYCMADEVGAEGTPHIHLFLAFSSPVRFSSLKKRWPTAHIEASLGTARQNYEYVRKCGKWENSQKKETSVDGTFEEWGVLPDEQQGKRTDLDFLYQQIKAGATDYEILENIGGSQMKNLGYVSKVRETLAREKTRKTFRMLTVTYIFGKTGVGKTRYVMEKYGYDGIFRVTDYKHPFDQYNSETAIVFDEFGDSLPIRQMLTYLEGYPLELPCRYANKWAAYTDVYIISNNALDEQYKNEQFDNPEVWHALLRRLTHIVEFLPDGVKIDYHITDDYQIVPDGGTDGLSSDSPFDNTGIE